MSHKAKVLLNEKLYPVVGNISMDQIVVNIEGDSAYNSDEVILLGSDGKNNITEGDCFHKWLNATTKKDIATAEYISEDKKGRVPPVDPRNDGDAAQLPPVFCQLRHGHGKTSPRR